MSERASALLPAEGTDFTAALAAPPVNNLRRIGGEMFNWTDHDPQRGPADDPPVVVGAHRSAPAR